MDRRHRSVEERLYHIERALMEISNRLAYLDDVQIPFIFSKVQNREKSAPPPPRPPRRKPEPSSHRPPHIHAETVDESSKEPEPETIWPETQPSEDIQLAEETLPYQSEDVEEDIEEAPLLEEIIPAPSSPGSRHWRRETAQPYIPEPHHEPYSGAYPEEPPWITERLMEKLDVSAEKQMEMELKIGGKWFLRLGLFFIGLAFFIVAYLIQDVQPWLKMTLTFLGGGMLIATGELAYTHHARASQKHLSSFGTWLVLGGLEVLYIGAWRTHIPHSLIDFREFMVLILAIVVVNIFYSLRLKHPLLILQYLTTFYLVCLAVYLNYQGSQPHFPALFLVGTTLILATDIYTRKPENTTLTLGFSSVLLLFLLGSTEKSMFYLLTGYLTILLVVSHFHREVDTFLGFGKVPDLFWGSILIISYLHSLNYLLQGGEELLFPVIFGLVSCGMLVTYYLPTLTTKKAHYRFTTDLEFYFIAGIFFLLFFKLSPNFLLLPVFLLLGFVIGLLNRRSQEGEAPRLLETREYLSAHRREDSFYILSNRIRFHVFLVIPVMIIILATAVMDTTLTLKVAYFTGFLSLTLVTGFIEHCRSDENALQTLRILVFGENGGFKELEFDMNPVAMDSSLHLHLKGVALAFIVELIALASGDSLLPLIPFFVYLAAVFFLNREYAAALVRQMKEHAKQESLKTMELVRELKERWHYDEFSDFRLVFLVLAGLSAVGAGLLSLRMALYSSLLFFLLVLLVQLDVRYVGRKVFFQEKVGDEMTGDFLGLFRDAHGFLLYLPLILLTIAGRLDFPGFYHYSPYLFFVPVLLLERYLFPRSRYVLESQLLSVVVLGLATWQAPFSGFIFLTTLAIMDWRYTLRSKGSKRDERDDDGILDILKRSEGFLIYAPFILLVILGRLDIPGLPHYGPYLFFLPMLVIERYFFSRARQPMAFHVLSIVVLGLVSYQAPLSGFVFLIIAGLIVYLDEKEVTREPNMLYVLPIIFLAMARLIVFLKGEDLFLDNGLPTPLPVTIEVVCIAVFLYHTRGILLRNLGWSNKTKPLEEAVNPQLIALLLLLPATMAPYHAGILLIPVVIIALSLKLNTPMENLLSTGVFLWAFWDLMALFAGGKELIYSNLILVGLLLTSLLLLEKVGRGNLSVASLLCALSPVFLVSSFFAFDGGTVTSASWTFFGAILITAGFSLEKPYLRRLGMLVVMLTAGKIIVYDLIEIPLLGRAFSLLIAGIALLGISYLYHLYREKEEKKAENIPIPPNPTPPPPRQRPGD